MSRRLLEVKRSTSITEVQWQTIGIRLIQRKEKKGKIYESKNKKQKRF